MAAQREVFICGVARTPIGNINGSLASLSAPALGALSIREALARARVSPAEVQEVYMGNVLTANVGQAPARQAARAAGIPDSCVCTTVNKVCASGAKAIILAAQARPSSSRLGAFALVRCCPHARCATQSIILGTAEVAVAGGMESMSNAPYLLPKARAGMKMGHGEVVDAVIKDGLWDPYGNVHMGICAEKCSRCANAAKRGRAESAESAQRVALR
jgi:acetyl-CoA C-acetyltransferase